MKVISRTSYANRSFQNFSQSTFLNTDQRLPSCLSTIIPSNGCGFPNSKSAHSPRTLTSEKTSNPPSNRKSTYRLNDQCTQRKSIIYLYVNINFTQKYLGNCLQMGCQAR